MHWLLLTTTFIFGLLLFQLLCGWLVKNVNFWIEFIFYTTNFAILTVANRLSIYFWDLIERII